MDTINIGNYKFLKINENGAEIYFSTAEGGLDFNKSKESGIKNLKNIREWFEVDNVGYLSQIHSNIVHEYNGNVMEGDGLITDKKGIAIGVFNADCVPVIMYDKKNKVASAVHSGWKGTRSNISVNAVNKMINEYKSSIEDLVVYIGPHNMQCCYEVSEELANEFKNLDLYKKSDILNGRDLSLQKCIIAQLESVGINKKQIKTLDFCTYCNKEYKLHSYRKDKGNSGRMFSFIIIK